MSRYFFIQSQDPFTESRTHHQFDLAKRLAAAGHDVTVLLVQNAVIVARRGARYMLFDVLQDSGVELRADAFSLRQRAIDPEQLKCGIATADLGLAIDAMLNGDKVIWN